MTITKSTLFAKTKTAIKVGYIDPTIGFVDGVSVNDANKYAEINPGTIFVFRDGERNIRYLTINEVNKLTDADTITTKKDCDDTPKPCGPPKLVIWGGEGIGAVANPVISPNSGAIIAVDLIAGGFGYKFEPFVSAKDDCNTGAGAVFVSTVGIVTSIVETFDNEGDFESYNIDNEEDTFPQNWGPDGEDLGDWSANDFFEFNINADPIAKEIDKYEKFLRQVPFWSTRKKSPRLVTAGGKSYNKVYNVSHVGAGTSTAKIEIKSETQPKPAPTASQQVDFVVGNLGQDSGKELIMVFDSPSGSFELFHPGNKNQKVTQKVNVYKNVSYTVTVKLGTNAKFGACTRGFLSSNKIYADLTGSADDKNDLTITLPSGCGSFTYNEKTDELLYRIEGSTGTKESRTPTIAARFVKKDGQMYLDTTGISGEVIIDFKFLVQDSQKGGDGYSALKFEIPGTSIVFDRKTSKGKVLVDANETKTFNVEGGKLYGPIRFSGGVAGSTSEFVNSTTLSSLDPDSARQLIQKKNISQVERDFDVFITGVKSNSTSATRSGITSTTRVRTWNDFMNTYAVSPVPESDLPGSDYAGTLFSLEWEENFPYDGEYTIRGCRDNYAKLYIDNIFVSDLVDFNVDPEPIRRNITQGNHKIRVDLLNAPIYETKVIPVILPEQPAAPVFVPSPELIDILRFFTIDFGGPAGATHFYTSNPNDEFIKENGFILEGSVFKLFKSSADVAGTVELYRLFNGTFGDHFFTTSGAEKNFAVLAGGYTYEGIVGKAYSEPGPDRVEVVRYFRPSTGEHFYATTIEDSQRQGWLSGFGYVREGPAFYAPTVAPVPIAAAPTTSNATTTTSPIKNTNVFNTIDYIDKANRPLWRTNPTATAASNIIDRYGICPFDTTTAEAQKQSYAGTHTIIWNNVNFPADGDYRVQIAVDDNVTLYIGDTQIRKEGFFPGTSTGTGDFNKLYNFKAGNYTIRAELDQIDVGPIAKGNPMVLAINIETSYATEQVITSKSWNINPMGVAITIEAPEPPIPQEKPTPQIGRCPNNPIWSTRFPNSKQKWYPVRYTKNNAWSKFQNRYALSPVLPLVTKGSDQAGITFSNSWDVEIPYRGYYAVKTTADNSGRVLIDEIEIAKSEGFGVENPTSVKTLLEAGKHTVTVEVYNAPIFSTSSFRKTVFNTLDWQAPPASDVETVVETAQINSEALIEILRFFTIDFGGPAGATHFYTSNPNDEFIKENGFILEGSVFSLFQSTSNSPGTVDVYRLFKGDIGDHFYTTDGGEKGSSVLGGYTYEGIIGKAYSEPGPDRVEVVRYFRPSTGEHFYTTTIEDSQRQGWLSGLGYVREGTAFYAPTVAPTIINTTSSTSLSRGTYRSGIKKDGVTYTGPNLFHYRDSRWSDFMNTYSVSPDVGETDVKELIPGYSGPGVYLDLTDYSSSVEVTFKNIANESDIFHGINIPNVGEIYETDAFKNFTLTGGKIYGPCTPTAPGPVNIYAGDEKPDNVKRGAGLRPNNQIVVEEGGDDWNDFVVSVNKGAFRRYTEDAYKNKRVQNQPLIGDNILTWKNVDFPEDGQYLIQMQADNIAELKIGGSVIKSSDVFMGEVQPFLANISKGSYNIEIKLTNYPTGIPEALETFEKNPVGVGLIITKDIVKTEVNPQAWQDANPMGISAVLIAPPCPKPTGGKGVVTEIVPVDPGNGYLPPLPDGPNYPVTLELTNYSVTLELTGVIVNNPGINYNCGVDEIVVTPSNGATLSYRCDPFGKITNVNVTNTAIGFVDLPTISINSDTGINFSAIPILTPVRDPIGVTTEKLIQVTDLVGLKQTGYVDGRSYYGAIFYDNGLKYAGYYKTAGMQTRIYDTLQESITANVTTPPSAIQRSGTDITSNDPNLNIPGTPKYLTDNNSG